MSFSRFSWVVVVPVLFAAANEPPSKPVPKPAPEQGRMASSAQRNENVAVYQIDNDAIKEANIRLGTMPRLVEYTSVESSLYAVEHGRPAGEALLLPSLPDPSSWHAELFGMHQNSVFNARTFFQVGPVQPSRRNYYGTRGTGTVPLLGAITGSFSQRKIRGMVNGNVLVPLPDERTPLATDPAVRAIISRFLAAYPDVAPNRNDFDPRALNTNAPQSIDEVDGSLRLDRDTGTNGRITVFHGITRQHTDAFQLVAGQNPDSDIHTVHSRINYRRTIRPGMELSTGFTFLRSRSLLQPEPNAVGPRVRFGFQIEELGPDSHYPINRAQNTFRYGAQVARQTQGGRHHLTFGGDLFRYQLNGVETNNQRGYFQFTNNFGRTAIQNLLLGTPSLYDVTLGDLARHYRNWGADFFFGDRFQLNPRVQLYLGLRYNLETAPVEIHHLDVIPYRCDCNNFSPRFSIAWQTWRGWVARASYGVSFGRIPPVAWQQVRNNLPHVRYVIVQNPDLLNPLAGIDLGSEGRHTPTYLSPDLVSPYSHQYSLTLERRLPARAMLRLGYTGSRSFKLMNAFITNRAEVVPGIPLTTSTVDERRADPRFYDVRQIVNAGIAYFDAGQVSIDLPSLRGLTANASYTYGKAIDEGSDFAFTAANRDLLSGRSQSQYDVLKDKKGLSNFDSRHILGLTWAYDLPIARGANGWKGFILSGWQLSGASVVKSGTPLTLYIGSDAPGFGNVDGGSSDRPNILDPSILHKTISHPDVAPQILRRDRFAYIQPGESRGSLGRNTFRRARIANLNGAITKQWRLPGGAERLAILRAESYNLTNTPQFDEPQRNLSSPSFGRITNTLNDGRIFQMVIRFVL